MTVRVHERDHESGFRKYLKVIKFATAWIENVSAEWGLKQGRRPEGNTEGLCDWGLGTTFQFRGER